MRKLSIGITLLLLSSVLLMGCQSMLTGLGPAKWVEIRVTQDYIEKTLVKAAVAKKNMTMTYDYYKASAYLANAKALYERGDLEACLKQTGIALKYAEKLN